MKVEVVRSDEGVELHLECEDGSKTVWLCDTDQAAIFKLASLLFSAQEDPKQAKRSILIGDYDAPEPEKKTLAERAAKVAERLEKGGLAKKGQSEKSDSGLDLSKFEELLKKVQAEKFYEPVAPATPFYNPPIHIYPASIPFQQPSLMPYVGDLLPGYGYPTIDVNVCGTANNGSNLTGAGAMTIKETSLGSNKNADGTLVTFFNVAMAPTEFE